MHPSGFSDEMINVACCQKIQKLQIIEMQNLFKVNSGNGMVKYFYKKECTKGFL